MRQLFRKFPGFLLISIASQRHNIYQCIKTMISLVLEGTPIIRLPRWTKIEIWKHHFSSGTMGSGTSMTLGEGGVVDELRRSCRREGDVAGEKLRSWEVGGELLVFPLAQLGGRRRDAEAAGVSSLPKLLAFPSSWLGHRRRAAGAVSVSSCIAGRSVMSC